LGLDNLDALVMIYKNWFDDARIDCKLTEKGIAKFFYAEEKLLDEHDKNYRNKATLRTSKKTL